MVKRYTALCHLAGLTCNIACLRESSPELLMGSRSPQEVSRISWNDLWLILSPKGLELG